MVALALAAAASLPGLSALAAEPSSSDRDAGAYVTDGTVHAVAHEPGANTYIGGDFDHVGPRSGRGLALGAVGSADTAVPLGSSAGSLPLPGDAEFPEVAGGDVHTVVPDGHGGWFIGGDFTSVGGLEIPRLAHVFGPDHPDSPGRVDASWAPAPNGAVLALALDSTTSATAWTLYAGGKFTSLEGSGVNRNYLAAWRIDAASGAPASPGDLDGLDGADPPRDPLKWAPGTNQTGGAPVYALSTRTVTVNVGAAPGTPTPMPLVFAGGEFTMIGKGTPVSRNRLAAIWGDGALKTDGTSAEGLLPDWNPGPQPFTASKVTALALGPSVDDLAGKTHLPVYWGAESTSAADRLGAARFELTKSTGGGTGFAYGGWAELAINGTVHALALDSTVGDNATGDTTNTLYVGGGFTMVGTNPRSGLAAFRGVPAASIDNNPACTAAVCPATLLDWSPQPQGTVSALATSGEGPAAPDATVYAGGEFTQIGSDTPESRDGLAALSRYSGQAGQGTALDWDARLAGGPVNALALAGDGLYAGGGFFSVGASERDNLAALDPGGALVEEFDTGTGCDGPGCADEVHALALAPDGHQLYIGGAFTSVDDDPSDLAAGEQREHLAALNLQLAGEVVDGWNPNPDGWVLSLDAAGERLYAGGAFDRIGAPVDGPQPARSRLAALERATGLLLDWDPNARCVEPIESCSSHGVYAVEASCAAVYVGGRFDRIGAVATGGTQPVRTNIARLDPFTGAAAGWDPNPQGNPGAVRALAARGGTVYAGGGFSTLGGAARQRLAALDANGSATSWNPAPNGLVQAVAVSGDGQTVFAGGEFSQIGDAQRWGLAALSAAGLGGATAWDPSVREPDPTTGAPSRSEAKAIAVSGGNVYAGGQFTDVGTSAQRGYAQFTSGGEGAAGEPLGCGGLPGQGTPQDSIAPSIGQPFVANGGQTLVVALSEATRIHVDLTGSGRGLMPMGRRAACAPDSAKLRSELRRALRATLRNLSARARARKLRKLIAKRACTVRVAPRSIDADGAAGENRISLAGPGPLAPGSYRAAITARDAAGNQAQPVTIDFGVGP